MSAEDRSVVNPIYGVFTTAGVIPAATQKTGTITSSGTVVTGSGTSFTTLSQVRKGDYIWAQGQVRVVNAIFNATRLDINRAFVPDIGVGVDFYVIRHVPNINIAIANNGGGIVDINTVDYDAQDLQEGDSLPFESMNGLGPIAYTPNGATVEISNGSIIKSGTATVTGTVDVDIVGPLGQQDTADSVAVTGNTGGFTAKLAFAPTTSAGAYTANDNIGGIITLANALRTSGGTAIIDSISLWALANQKPNLYIDFWDASPSGTYTNDAAQVIAGDQLKWLGMAEVAVGDWKDTGVISRCSIRPTNFGIKGNASTSIYMTIQDKTGITLGSTAGLFGYVTLLQD